MAVQRFRVSLAALAVAAACDPAPAPLPPPPAPAASVVPVPPATPAPAGPAPIWSPESLELSAVTRLAGTRRDTLSTRVTIINRATAPVLAYHGDCAVELFAYHTADRAGEPVWRSSRRNHVCLDYLDMKTLAPGETYSPAPFGVRVPVQQILGDSLPAGRYYFDAEFRLIDDRRFPQAHHLTRVPAGDADLRAR